jgi:hypothetical protein
MSDFFHFDDAKFAASCRQLSTAKLQESEIRYSRSKVASGFGLFYGIATTAATHGAAFPIPLYCIRANELASRKRDAIQTELARRGIPPTKTSFRDVRHGFGAAWLGQLVLPLAEGLAADGIGSGAGGDISGGKHVDVEEVAKEVGKQAPGEAVTGAYIKGHKIKK